MKLSTILPKHSELNRSKFYDIGGDVKRCTIRIKHCVSGVVALKERIGEANIDYNIDFPKKSDFTGGMVVGEGPYVGIQSTDLLNRALDELRPRTNYAFGKVSKTIFDLRALSFALGAACAMGVGNVDFDVCPNPSGYRTLGTGWSVPDMGDIILGPEIITTAKEFATLMSICGSVGIKSVTILRDDIPGIDGTHLVGRSLAAFALRVQTNILQAAFDAMCYGAHKMAFECGKTVGMRLNGHTDEGGWIRSLFASPTYPTPVGYVFGVGTHFGDMPLQETIMHEDVMRVVIGDYLEFVALFPVADYHVHGEHSVIASSVKNPTRPGDYDLLFESVYHVFRRVRELVCDAVGYHHDANDGGGSLSGYITRNPVDRHFGNSAIMPWFFVEPSPLLTREHTGYPVPARHGDIIKMPLFNAVTIRHVGNGRDTLGRAGPGSRSFIVRKPTDLRAEGASYLLSSAYSPDDGLAQLRYVTQTPSGDAGHYPMFVGDKELSLALNRWVTPHNPMPSPMEGRADLPTILEYRHVSKRTDLTPSEILSGTVESNFGVFHVVGDSPTAKAVTHRDIPTYMVRRLKLTTASLQPLETIEVVTFGEETPQPITVLPPQLTVHPTPASDTDDTVGKQPKQPHRTDAPPPPDQEGPKIQVSPATAGVKPVMKTVKPAKPDRDDESGNGEGQVS